MRLLVIEDDVRSAQYLLRGLAESGHVADHVADSADGLAMAGEGIYDVVVLDRRMPGLNGIDFMTALRQRDPQLPVLMVSALSGTQQRVEGLRAGADDYLAKPYAFAEILARIEALARRNDASRRQPGLTVGDLSLDMATRSVQRGGRALQLQAREFALLEYLMRHAGQVVTRTMLLEAVWGYDFDPRGNIIDMHMHRLRSKVERDGEPALIQTVPGAGYCLRPPGCTL
ncbi:response regulator transcription factor [Duganella levis]|uniref:Response regulator n=1 Tax=Duganella levis TaxID=2692169 RepID=A0ABW9VTH2_9BURK|nr:response regulator transcription factor [Duganella levis]MYN24935.1 response regulator [Duganella levis]